MKRYYTLLLVTSLLYFFLHFIFLQNSRSKSANGEYGEIISKVTLVSPIRSIKKSNHFVDNEIFHIGFVLDVWFDVCLEQGIEGSLWHPMFPKVPQKRQVLISASSDGLSASYLKSLKRVYGYLNIEEEGEYKIRLRSPGVSELLIYDTKHTISAADMLQNINSKTFVEVHYLKSLNKRLRKSNDLNYSGTDEFTSFFHSKVYFLEFLVIGPFELYWKHNYGDYRLMSQANVFHSREFFYSYAPYSFFVEKHQYKKRFPVEMNIQEQRKFQFFQTPILPTKTQLFGGTLRECEVHILKPPKIKLFQGVNLIDNLVVYPKEYFEFTDNMPKDRLLMKEDEAVSVSNEVFDYLNNLFNRSLQLNVIIHVHKNLNGQFKPHADERISYYYVELHVKSKVNNQIQQTSHFVQKSSNGLCFMEHLKWNPKAEIFLLTPVKNQYAWVKLLLKVLEDLLAKTNEKKVTLVLLDNESNDGDYQSLLSSSNLKTAYIRVPGARFNKVKALNLGLKRVEDTVDNIAMVMDLHLELPLDFFDRTRKMTIKGNTAFSPTLLRLGECTHEMYTDIKGKQGKWQDDGPGIMAMYRSDWITVGGFNEEMFANKWGGEDWELVDRIIEHGFHIIHYRLPRFYHLVHSRKEMWDVKI